MTEKQAPPADPFADALKDLDPEESGYAPAFIFDKPGDSIIGKVLEIGEGYSAQYGAHPCVTVLDEASGEPRSIHIFHSTMLSAFERVNPEIGERIAVKRMTDKESLKSGYTYHRFLVKVDRSAPTKKAYRDIQTDLQPNPDTRGMDAPEVGEDDLPF